MRGAVAPKGPMTYASLVSVIIKGVGLEVEIWGFKGRKGTGIWASGLGLRPLSWNLGLVAEIWD